MSSDVERTLYDRSFEDNPVYRRIFSRLPECITQTFTGDQLQALYWASGYQKADHAIAMRRRLSLFGRRFYMAFFFGADRRRKLNAMDKFVLNGLKHPVSRIIILCTLYFLVMLVLMTLGVLALYIVKSAFGLDLMDGHSLLHDAVFSPADAS